MRGLAVACLLGGCGRIAFDSIQGSAACSIAVTVPDPITVSGQTYTYANFMGGTTPLGSVQVSAHVRDSGAMLASTTSDANGLYALSIATHGVPVTVDLDYIPGGYLTTALVDDQPLDRDIVGPNNMMNLELGDGPIWGDGQMSSVYGAAGVTWNKNAGSFGVIVHDCSEQVVDGVAVAIDPPPGAIAFSGANGFVSGATTTQPPFEIATVFNAVPGVNHITATKAGFTIAPIDITVAAGESQTSVIVHAVATPER